MINVLNQRGWMSSRLLDVSVIDHCLVLCCTANLSIFQAGEDGRYDDEGAFSIAATNLLYFLEDH